MSSVARIFFNNLGQTLAQGIGSAHAASQMHRPPVRGQKPPAQGCTPCAARAMVAQAKNFRGGR